MNPSQQAYSDVQFKRMGFVDGIKLMSFELKVNFGIPTEFDIAPKVSQNILIERQISGVCHRILVE